VSQRELLRQASEWACRYLDGLPERPVGARLALEPMRAAFGGPLPERGEAPLEVLERLAREGDPGIVASAGPRYFGFVVGGALPIALAADWLTSAWDQNAGLYVLSPANAVAEEVAGGWLVDLFGLPAGASFGFVTGCNMANFAGLAAARHALLERHGWNVEERGLYGAPELDVVVGEEAHVTVFAALQFLGLGRERVRRVPVDGQGRMRADALASALAGTSGPLLICAQAGNVNTGAIDPLDEIAALARARGAWLHVDGAFGLWAAASPSLAPLLRGVEQADSWATDAHKWLNVPYDCGLVFCAHPEVHRAAMMASAPYLVQTAGAERDPFDWVPEFSRRARGFTVYAALRCLGREGVRELVERCCRLARRMAERLARAPQVEVLNEVVLNQALVRFHPAGRPADAAAADALTHDVVRRVQAAGICWLGATRWQGRAAMRVSVSNWSTTEADVDRSADSVLEALRSAG
jgi:glutamate/tyrosine decarboxylase-like PLP-dependent enzyme